eukprot:6957452-Alexandrium_andersonii.AAC.1
MSASLVGSEMCIRDRPLAAQPLRNRPERTDYAIRPPAVPKAPGRSTTAAHSAKLAGLHEHGWGARN